MKIIDHPSFNVNEFAERWKKARLSALYFTVENAGLASKNDTTEEDILLSLSKEEQDKALKNIFNFSRKFGLSASKFLGLSFEVSDIADVLPKLGTACFQGKWQTHNSAQVLKRNGCWSLEKLKSFGCDYWREALDGLVMGLGDNERLARHRSCGHGDSDCVDVLFTEEYTVPKIISTVPDNQIIPSSHGKKFGPIPDNIVNSLKSIEQKFNKLKVQLTLEGLSEGTLYYRLDAKEGVLCGAGGKLMHDSLTREIKNLFPTIALQDVAPLAVYGGST